MLLQSVIKTFITGEIQQLINQELADKILPIMDQHLKSAESLAIGLKRKTDKKLHNLNKHWQHLRNNPPRLNDVKTTSITTSRALPLQTGQNTNTRTFQQSEPTPYPTGGPPPLHPS